MKALPCPRPFPLAAFAALLLTAQVVAAWLLTTDNRLHAADAHGTTGNTIDELPYHIDRPGAYVLATTLTAPPGAGGIVVAADDVTIDLAGHALIGQPAAKRSRVESLSHGIAVDGEVDNLTVRGGTIRDFEGAGIEALTATTLRLRGVRVIGNGGEGLLVGREGSVRDCLASSNGSTGILALRGSEIVDTSAIANRGDGIHVDERSLVRGCRARRNCGDGIRAGRKAVIVENVSTENGSATNDRPCRGAGIAFEGNPTRLGRNYTSDNDSELEHRR